MKNLHQEAKELLFKVHARHTATMGTKEKEKHSLDKIYKVTVHHDHIKVYYKNADWYHYTIDGTWY